MNDHSLKSSLVNTMDSPYFLISNNNLTSSASNTNLITSNIINDLEQSSSSFSYDPLDGLSLLDQQGLRFYDFLGANNNLSAGGGGGGGGVVVGGGRISPSASFNNHYPHDQIDSFQHKNFPFNTDPNNQDDDVDLHDTLTSFVSDLGGVDSDAGYNSGVDLFASNNMADCSDSTEAYYLKLALEQNNTSHSITTGCHEFDSCNTSSHNNFDHSDNVDNIYNLSNNVDHDCNSYNNCNGDSNNSQKSKRSVLMNLLIDGSDVGAGYTSHNCRALPNRRTTNESRIMATTAATARY